MTEPPDEIHDPVVGTDTDTDTDTDTGVTPPGRRLPRALPAWVLVVALVASCWLTGFAAVNLRDSQTLLGGAVARAFPRVEGSGVDTGTVDAAWEFVRQQYVVRNVSGSAGTTGALKGLIQALHDTYNDRFSAVFTAQEYAAFSDQIGGRRQGVIGIGIDGRCAGGAICPAGKPPTEVVVTEVLRDQPAEKAGVRRGDVLQAIDGTPLTSLGADPAAQINKAGPMIRGDAGTQVHLTVLRGGATQNIVVTRADLALPSVYSQRFGTTVYVQVTSFSAGIAQETSRRVTDALHSGATGVVLDLRHNGGGLVSEAQGLASLFLQRGTNETAVVVRRGRLDSIGSPDTAQHTDTDEIQSNLTVAPTQHLAVLVDGDSASASEIVSAAFKDYHRAALIGTTTFGKGSVQEDFSLPDGGDLHLTVERWFGPSGESIEGAGITPNTHVDLPDDDHRFRLDSEGADASADAQLQAALAAVAG